MVPTTPPPSNSPSASAGKAGLYAWAGPDTIRMTRVKYGNHARVDEESFMNLYADDVLSHAKQTLGTTDMWVTYAWGFARESEREQRAFLRSSLEGFSRNGIRAHAYVQGLNAVTADVHDDVYCRDAAGRHIPYSRGRSLLCANNPAARALVLERVADASAEAAAGVFVDNILTGTPPVFVCSDYLPPFGCMCRWCDGAFRTLTGHAMPRAGFRADDIDAAIRVRSSAVTSLLAECSALARSRGKQFGVNLYDPFFHTPELFFGYDFRAIDPLLDYRLIENHALLSDGRVANNHLGPILGGDKPVFVVSYRHGIGRDGAFTQRDVDAVYADARALGYAPCVKASEFVTKGVWHALDIRSLRTPKTIPVHAPMSVAVRSSPRRSTSLDRWLGPIMARSTGATMRCLFDRPGINRIWSRSKIYLNILRKPRLYDTSAWTTAAGR